MPSYKVHLVAGAATFIALLQIAKNVVPHLQLHHIAMFGIASLVGSLFPDIDIKTSKMQRYFYLLVGPVIILVIIQKSWNIFFLLAGMCMLIPVIQHRTLTHQAWFVVAIPCMTALFLNFSYQLNFHVTIFTALFFLLWGPEPHHSRQKLNSH